MLWRRTRTFWARRRNVSLIARASWSHHRNLRSRDGAANSSGPPINEIERDWCLRRWDHLALAINETWWRRCPPGLDRLCQIFKKSAVLGRTRAKKAPRPLWLLLLFQSVPTRHLSMPGHFCAFFAQVRPVPHFFEKNLTELCLSWRASPAILAGLASFRVLFPPRGSSLRRPSLSSLF